MIVSHTAFMWFMTTMVLILCAISGTRDIVVLIRLLRREQRTPAQKDRVFGSVVGLVMVGIGLGGVVKYHLL